jgi:organic radical activating enzyme
MIKLYHEAETQEERMTATMCKLVIRDEQAEGDAALGAAVREQLVTHLTGGEPLRISTVASFAAKMHDEGWDLAADVFNAIADVLSLNAKRQ